MKPGGKYRTDVTVWAVTALYLTGEKSYLLKPARARLALNQLESGVVPFLIGHQEAMWTTPLAILAWWGSNAFSSNKDRAVDILLKTTGLHWAKKTDSPTGT